MRPREIMHPSSALAELTPPWMSMNLNVWSHYFFLYILDSDILHINKPHVFSAGNIIPRKARNGFFLPFSI